VVPRDGDQVAAPQQIGYVNIVPARSEHGGFESFGDAVRRFNDQLRQRPLPGTRHSIDYIILRSSVALPNQLVISHVVVRHCK